MQYLTLVKLYYKDRAQYDLECIARATSSSTVKLPMKIHDNSAFYINCNELTLLITKVYALLGQLHDKINELPNIALESYMTKCLVDEVMLTNDIEGVHSTRREIINLLDNMLKSENTKKRLQGLVKKYRLLMLGSSGIVKLATCNDIRHLYDEIVADEITHEDLPDGKYFRKSSVSVVTATDKEKHRGIVPPEKNIIKAMEQSLSLLKNDDIPQIISVALLHYFIGYIHPFYDGNGRLSRFISSYLISTILDKMVALRLSYSIKNKKKEYYDAFDTVNDKRNFGDATPFIIMFLEMLVASEKDLMQNLTEGKEKLEYYAKLVETKRHETKADYIGIIWLFVQDAIFGGDGVSIETLAQAQEVSVATASKKIKGIMNSPMGLFVKRERIGHKFIYMIELEKFEAYLHSK